MFYVRSSCDYEVVASAETLEEAKQIVEDEVGPVTLVETSKGDWMAMQGDEEITRIVEA